MPLTQITGDNIDGYNFNIGVTTATSITATTGPVLIGTATSTGTASQRLQVSGGAYVSSNLGIGVTNPTVTLHSVGKGLFDTAGSGTAGSVGLAVGSGGVGLNWESGNALSIHTLNQERVRIDSSGNLGIGTASPTTLLQVASSSAPIIRVTDTRNTVNLDLQSASLAAYFGTSSNHDLGLQTNSIERLRIDKTGNLLINTQTATGTASQPLQVTGGAYVSGNLGVGKTNSTEALHVDGNRILHSLSGINTVEFGYAAGSGDSNVYGLYVPANKSFRLFSGGSQGFSVNTTGVGIGTTTPATTLDVVGGIKGVITSGTAQVSTAGTSINFTNIPSWAKRITVMFDGVSMNTTVNWLIQIGDSGGIENSGYVSATAAIVDTPSYGASNSTAGFIICGTNALLGDVHGGAYVLTNLTGNTWCLQGSLATTTSSRVFYSAGSKTLSATLDRVRITSTTGTPTFDAGTINILYEG